MKKERYELLKRIKSDLDYYKALAETWVNDPVDPEEGEVAELLGKLAEGLRDAMVDIDDLLTF